MYVYMSIFCPSLRRSSKRAHCMLSVVFTSCMLSVRCEYVG